MRKIEAVHKVAMDYYYTVNKSGIKWEDQPFEMKELCLHIALTTIESMEKLGMLPPKREATEQEKFYENKQYKYAWAPELDPENA